MTIRKRFLSTGRAALTFLVTAGRVPPKYSPEQIESRLHKGDIRKVLFIRTDLKLGDALASTAMLNGMKRTFPKTALQWLANPYNSKALNGNPAIDRLWIWNKKASLREIWTLWRSLRKERFGLVIVAFSHTPSFTSFMIARSLGAKIVWSYATEAEPWSRYLANVELPMPAESKNEIEKYADLVRPLCGAEPAVPCYFPTAEDEQWAQEQWRNLRIPSGKKVVALFPGGNANRSDRFWPMKSWEELAVQLGKNDSYFVYFMKGPETDAIPFGRLGAFLKKVSLFVCSDGGTFHLAVASGVPTLGLFISTEASRWTPPVAWASSLQAPDHTASRLTVDMVWNAIEKRLSRETFTYSA